MILLPSNINGTARSTPKHDKLMEVLSERLDYSISKLSNAKFHGTPPVKFLKALLLNVHEDKFLTGDLFDLYADEILPMVGQLEMLFDFVRLKRTLPLNYFTEKGTTEYLIPTSGIVGSRVTVFDDWSEWKLYTNPVKLVSHDSSELNLKSDQPVMTFEDDQPTYVAICIDVAALLLKYIIFTREHGYDFGTDSLPELFITNIILPDMYYDRLQLWSMKYLSNVFNDTTEDVIVNGLNVKSLINNASTELLKFKDGIERGKIRVGDLLETGLIGYDSAVDLFDAHSSEYNVPYDHKYIAAEVIKILSTGEFYLTIMEAVQNKQLYSNWIKSLLYDIRTVERSSWESHIPDAGTKAIVTMFINTLKLLTI